MADLDLQELIQHGLKGTSPKAEAKVVRAEVSPQMGLFGEEPEEPKKAIEYTPEKFAGVVVTSVHNTTGDETRPSGFKKNDFSNIGKRLWKSSVPWETFFKKCTQIFNDGNQPGQGPTTVQNMAKVYAAIIAKNPAVQQFVRQFAYVTSGDASNTTRTIKFKPVAGDAPVPPEAPPLPRRT